MLALQRGYSSSRPNATVTGETMNGRKALARSHTERRAASACVTPSSVASTSAAAVKRSVLPMACRLSASNTADQVCTPAAAARAAMASSGAAQNTPRMASASSNTPH